MKAAPRIRVYRLQASCGARPSLTLAEFEAPDCSRGLLCAQEFAREGHTVVLLEDGRPLTHVECQSR